MQTGLINRDEAERKRGDGHGTGRSSITGTMMKTYCSIAAFLAVVAGMPFSSMADIFTFQAETGTLGSSYVVRTNSGVIFISNTNNNVGFGNNRPQIPGRVATYVRTFPSAGTFNLYARMRVGPGNSTDDSFFYANGFGAKSVNSVGDWVVVNGVEARGFINPTDVVTTGGSAGTNVWKWINVSQDTGSSGATPVTFNVVQGNLTQTFQIGGKDDGLDIDKFAFGLVGSVFTVADLDAATEIEPPPAPPPPGFASVPRFLTNGDLQISYAGNPGQVYWTEWTDSLVPPMTWTPHLTNTADLTGLVNFTYTPAGSHQFHRVSTEPTGPVPLVYTVENTGAAYPPPPLLTLGNLPIILPLTDPFMWSATDPSNWTYPSGRSINFADWSRRRAEIKAEIENYEIGFKPPVDPAMIFASLSGSGTTRTLTVRTTNIVDGVVRTLTQTATISLPGSSGTFPAIIGFNSANGSISLGGRAIATINYQLNQVTSYGSQSDAHPYYQLYAAPYSPTINSTTTGQYSAWAWGCSRLIDGLYKLNGDLGNGVQINLERIGVTGCSYAGKGALFCGAFDERIALTIPQESGGGGAPNWRYSYQLGANPDSQEPVEGLGQTDHNWFSEGMFAFAGDNTARLPHDHHELMAMVAPRALFATSNPQGAAWLSNPSAYVSFKAVQRVYETFGISDRFGYNGMDGANHCQPTTFLVADVGAFLDKFLLGMTNINTITNRHVPANYSNINDSRWTAWWGTTSPTFP